MPEMQEQFPAIAMDGGLSRSSMAFEALGLLPVVYAGNAGAISGYHCLRTGCVAGATFQQQRSS
jgi:hypothetical protein